MKFSRQPFEPEQVDEVIEYEFKDKDAEGLKPLDEWFIIQQIELPDKMYRVIEHRARKYLDPTIGQIHLAPIPDEVRKGGLFGAGFTDATESLSVVCSGAGDYVLELAVDDSSDIGTDTITIHVFENACEATKSLPDYVPLVGDLNEDCRVDDIDLAMLEENWLKNIELTSYVVE